MRRSPALRREVCKTLPLWGTQRRETAGPVAAGRSRPPTIGCLLMMSTAYFSAVPASVRKASASMPSLTAALALLAAAAGLAACSSSSDKQPAPPPAVPPGPSAAAATPPVLPVVPGAVVTAPSVAIPRNSGIAGTSATPVSAFSKLSAPDLQKIVAGNTAVGIAANGQEYWAYFDPAGTIKFRQGEFRDTGKWRVADEGQLCSTLDKINAGVEHCYTLYRNGGSGFVFERPEGNPVGSFSVKPGDAYKL